MRTKPHRVVSSAGDRYSVYEPKNMSSNKTPIIEIKNIGKRYTIAHQQGGYVALRDIFANVLKNPFKFAKHKAKQIAGLVVDEEFWALKDVNLEVERGEIIGIIGKNGSGKSTLLKVLSGITPPTEGEIIMRGRAASLLEVGTGFHPELTGRENIFLNGAILGMSRKEIVRKFDEIVAFSGVEKFLDTPVKHYSSGMYVRLAFSVAAHMEPDILIVDEVLAVGDSEFQKKCLGKMEEVTEKDGRTILFVSHNLDAVRQLCKRSMLLENGKVKMIGETGEVIEKYFSPNKPQKGKLSVTTYRNGSATDAPIHIDSIYVKDHEDEAPVLRMGEIPTLVVRIVVEKEIEEGNISISLHNSEGVKTDLAFSLDDDFHLRAKEGCHEIEFTPHDFSLPPGRYTVAVGINESCNTTAWDSVSYYPIFEIENHGSVAQWNFRPWAIHHSHDNTWKLSKPT